MTIDARDMRYLERCRRPRLGGAGRIVYATCTDQLLGWLAELGVPPAPVAPMRIRDVVPDAVVDGPVPELAPRVRAAHEPYHWKR